MSIFDQVQILIDLAKLGVAVGILACLILLAILGLLVWADKSH